MTLTLDLTSAQTRAALGGMSIDERDMDRLQAIITSMTPEERANPGIINGSRRRRIARGSGTTVQAVNQLIKQFGQLQKMMRQMGKGGGMPRMPRLPGRR
jgi:signal recognition particle subunit SRP54